MLSCCHDVVVSLSPRSRSIEINSNELTIFVYLIGELLPVPTEVIYIIINQCQGLRLRNSYSFMARWRLVAGRVECYFV